MIQIPKKTDKEINTNKIEVIPCKDAQNQNNVGCCEDHNADYNEARDDEFESYVAEVEEALAADEAAYEAFLSKEEEERSKNEDEPLTDDEYEHHKSLEIECYVNFYDPFEMEAA